MTHNPSLPSRDCDAEQVTGTSTGDSAEHLDSLEMKLKGMLEVSAGRTPPPNPIGQTLGETYTLLRRLGEGGFGTVFLAKHCRTEGQVAIKLIHEDRMETARLLKRFELEAKHTASLNHPNIVRVFDYGQDTGTIYIAMEYVPGESLRKKIQSRGQLDNAEVAIIARQVLLALEAAHDNGIVHRDIKPANILVSGEGEDLFVKVLDFGIARALEGPGVGTTGSLGSLYHMAPEQFDGAELSVMTDLYGLGCTVYEMVSGRPPFTGSFVALAKAHASEVPQRLEGVPHAFAEWVQWLLEKDPRDRPATAREALDALRALATEASPQTPTTPPKGDTEGASEAQATAQPETPTTPTRPWRVRALLGLCLIGVVLLIIFFIR